MSGTGAENPEYAKYEQHLGGWKIVRKIGQGSIGRVFEICRCDDPGWRAALKVISLPGDEEEIKRALSSGVTPETLPQYYNRLLMDFVNEYGFMERLQGNDYIVTYGSHVIIPHEDGIGGDILIRMELLRPLIDYALDHETDEADVLSMGLDLSDALMACEEAGVLHRDIKPDNIFVSDDGVYKLGDFGIARIIEETEMNLSHKGTFAYMAPEVYRGEEYGIPADIYSLGLVMYKYLNNGRLPFMPKFPEELVYDDSEKAFNRRVRKETLPPPMNGSPELQAVVLKSCSANTADRYRTAAEMHKALEDVRDGVFEAKHSVLKGRKVSWAAVFLAVLAAAGAAVWAFIPKEITAITGVEQGEEIYIGETISPEYAVEPDWFKDEPVSFASSDESVITVDEEGRITATGVGDADLKLSARDHTENIRINVVPKVEEIGGIEPEISLIERETVILKPELSPEKFAEEPVSYDSSNAEVAAVTDEGLVIAVSPGTATVRLSAGGCSRDILVTVEAEPEPVRYDSSDSKSKSKSKPKSNSKSKSKSDGYIDDIDDEYFD